MYRVLLLIVYLSISILANEKVVLQLKWLHQFQFAGYYAAKEKGFYEELGLDVEIRQRDIRFNNIQQVIDGESQYGVADSILLLYKSKKEPVVIVSPIFQHSPNILISLRGSGISSAYDLENKDLIFYENDTDGFSLSAMFKKLNVMPNIIRGRVKDDYLKVANGEVDLLPGYISNEPFYFRELGKKINIIDPSNYGFDLYGDMLFTSESEAKNHPMRVKKFKEATLKGWEYALENQEELISLIHEKYNSTKSIEHLRYEAKAIERVVSKDTIPLGKIEEGRMKYIHSLYKDYGLIDSDLEIEELIFDEYKKEISFSKEQIEYLKENPTLTIPNMIAFPPFSYSENGKPLGYTIDYMSLMAKYMGVKLNIIQGKTWEEYLPLLKNGEIDVIPHVAFNKQRDKYITFTDFAHLNFSTAIALKKSTNFKNIKDLKNKVLAVQNRTFQHVFLEENFPKQKLLPVSSSKEGVKAVSQGKADAMIGNLPSLEYYIQNEWLSDLKTNRIEGLGLKTDTELFMGVSKGNFVLKSILEKVDNSITASEKLKLKQKWMNIDLKEGKGIEFSSNELNYLDRKKELKMCIDPSWMPFEKIENGEHIGITSDYMKIFQEQIPIPIKLKSSKNWLETVSFAKSRECDFVTSMSETNERKKDFNFTKSLMDVPIVIATKLDKPFINSIDDVSNKKLGIVKGFGYINKLRSEYPNIELVEVGGAKDGLQRVIDGDIYGFIGVLQAVGYNIQKNYFDNLKIAGKLDESWSFPMAIRNDEPLLSSIFNKLISNISKETHSSILNKWVSVKFQEAIDYTKLMWVTLVFIIILIIVVYKNRSIKEINEKMQKYIDVIDENVLTSSTDKHGIIISVSQAFCKISGYSKDELLGQNHRVIRHPDMDEKVYKDIWETISHGKVWKGEIKNRKKDGAYYWVLATISPNFDRKGLIVGYTSIRQDITNRKIIEEISITDELTTLFNKRYFNEMFEKEINRVKRDEQRFGFIMFDVDHFKQYNDNYGHQKGDEVLAQIGKKLNALCKRSTDISFRIGGEEFGIIFHPHFEENALEFAQIVRESIEELKIEHKYNSASKYITISIGLYITTWQDIKDSKEIYKITDDALYKAKKEGRNRVCTVD